MRSAICTLVFVVTLAGAAAAKVGDSAAAFASGPLVQQLGLTPSDGARYVSDDQAITVDLVLNGGVIAQQIMYLPLDERRGFQVSMFLQDALGSVVGAQVGLVAFRSAVANRQETSLPFGGLTMRFTPIAGGLLRVQVIR